MFGQGGCCQKALKPINGHSSIICTGAMEIYCICMFYLNEHPICPILTSIQIILFSIKHKKVQVGKDQERRNQKKIPTPKTEVGKNQTNSQVLIP